MKPLVPTVSEKSLFTCIGCTTVLLAFLLRQAQLLTLGEIALSEPLTSVDDLNNVDALLECHDGRREDDQDQGDGMIHLVGTGEQMVSDVVCLSGCIAPGSDGRTEPFPWRPQTTDC